MSEDAFLGVFDDLVKEEDKEVHNHPEIPPQVRELLEKLGGQVSAATVVIGPDGVPNIRTDSPADLPEHVKQAMMQAINTLGLDREEDQVPFNKALDAMREEGADLTGPIELLQMLGLPQIEAEHIKKVIGEMTNSIGTDIFSEPAFEALYTQTELFESMSFNALMYFVVGMLTERERRKLQDDSVPESGRGLDQGAEPDGDSGGDREGD